MRPLRYSLGLLCDKVSIHAPAWGATDVGQNIGRAIDAFQSTHPRGVRHVPSYEDKPTEYVSIHAPAWGATRAPGALRLPLCGFNPRTRVGCDYEQNFMPSREVVFQSTHPRGVRLMEIPRYARVFDVSIHAPAWGATGLLVSILQISCVFQSTHPRGVRRTRL